jgi:hypothetical protein
VDSLRVEAPSPQPEATDQFSASEDQPDNQAMKGRTVRDRDIQYNARKGLYQREREGQNSEEKMTAGENPKDTSSDGPEATNITALEGGGEDENEENATSRDRGKNMTCSVIDPYTMHDG